MTQCILKMNWKGKDIDAYLLRWKTLLKKKIRNLMKIYLSYEVYHIFIFKL